MDYKIIPTKEFEKDFKKLDQNLKTRIKKKIERVAMNLTRYKHLSYNLNESCRL